MMRERILCWRPLKNGSTIPASDSVHIDLDGAWPADCLEAYVECRDWGRRLRYSATAEGIDRFYAFIRERMAKFTLFGSGDYHHLTAVWLRKLEEPVVLVSFDNHPDWDIRPPRWCCGTWMNRALELPTVRKAAIWGCGNFELNWPTNLFVSRAALRAQRYEIWPWTERLKSSGRKRWPGMTREDWQVKFRDFAQRIAGENVYITVDLDCLHREDSTSNWEHGLFQVRADIRWLTRSVNCGSDAKIVGGRSLRRLHARNQVFARWKQRIESQPRSSPTRAGGRSGGGHARNGSARGKYIWQALRLAGSRSMTRRSFPSTVDMKRCFKMRITAEPS